MRKAWLAATVAAAAFTGLGFATSSASAGVATLIPAAQNAVPHESGLIKVHHRRRYYYAPRYYSYYAPYAYDYAYYPPPVVYYAVPAPRYVPGPAYYPYAGYYVRPWRSRYYYGW
jgi:hypothetical protein